MIGYGDNIGSGFPTILNAWGEEKWRKPDLSQDAELHQVELKLWMVSLMPQECTEYLQTKFGLAYAHLKKEAQIILGTAYLENGVTNARMQSILNLYSIEIGHILSELVELDMLIPNRKGRWTSYQLNEDYLIQPEQVDLKDILCDEIKFKNKADEIIYNYIKTNGFITTHQILEITNITSMAGASIALNRLIKMGLVKKVRQGRHFIYQLKS